MRLVVAPARRTRWTRLTRLTHLVGRAEVVELAWPNALGEMEAVEQQARDVSDDRQAERRYGGKAVSARDQREIAIRFVDDGTRGSHKEMGLFDLQTNSEARSQPCS